MPYVSAFRKYEEGREEVKEDPCLGLFFSDL